MLFGMMHVPYNLTDVSSFPPLHHVFFSFKGDTGAPSSSSSSLSSSSSWRCQGGLDEHELVDVLSMTDDVMAVVWRTLDLPMKRFPSHLWLRIRHRLGDLLLTRAGDGGIVWRNRKLQAIAATLFAPARSGYLCPWFYPMYSIINNAFPFPCMNSHPLGVGQVLLRQGE